MTAPATIAASRARIVVVGGSSGALAVLRLLLGPLEIELPIIVTLHVGPGRSGAVRELLAPECRMPVHEPFDKAPVQNGVIYVAPSDYHLLLESTRTFALSVGPKVNYSRPSIDVLFESACDVYGSQVVAVLLSGANSDGALGAKSIRDSGGFVMVQDPASCEAATMPSAAIESASPQLVTNVDALREHLSGLTLPDPSKWSLDHG